MFYTIMDLNIKQKLKQAQQDFNIKTVEKCLNLDNRNYNTEDLKEIISNAQILIEHLTVEL